jgi:ABC-type phosphate transport system substrate-binding protein
MPRCTSHLVAAALTLATGALVAGAPASAALAGKPAAIEQRVATSAPEFHVAVIVNLSNPVTDLSLKELRSIVMFQRTQWPNGRKITVALYEPGYPERETVLQRVYGMTEAAFTRYFLHGTFTGQIPTGPRQLATSDGLRRFVVNVPAAVGFIRLTDVDASVKKVSIDGQAAGAPGYSLTVEPTSKPSAAR